MRSSARATSSVKVTSASVRIHTPETAKSARQVSVYFRRFPAIRFPFLQGLLAAGRRHQSRPRLTRRVYAAYRARRLGPFWKGKFNDRFSQACQNVRKVLDFMACFIGMAGMRVNWPFSDCKACETQRP